MRIYIIGNDDITLCREPPTAVNAGEIAVTSNEELHAAALNGKRLLALWNALPGVEKRRKVGDRRALIVNQHRTGTLLAIGATTLSQCHDQRFGGVPVGADRDPLSLDSATSNQGDNPSWSGVPVRY
jgi:hypothetical protein